MSNPHFLKGEKVSLRPLEMRDVDFMQTLENDPRSWAVGNVDAPYSREAIAKYIKNETLGLYVTRQRRMVIEIETQAEGKKEERGERVRIGFVDVYEFEPENMNAFLGIYLNPEFRGMGYGGEALGLFVDYCERHIGIISLAAHIGINNNASLRLFGSHGFERVGVLRKWKRVGTEWGDVVLVQRVCERCETE